MNFYFRDSACHRRIGDTEKHTEHHQEIHSKKAIFTTYQYHLSQKQRFLSVFQAPQHIAVFQRILFSRNDIGIATHFESIFHISGLQRLTDIIDSILNFV